jgi:hypothetical protein
MSITGINSYNASQILLDLYGTQGTDNASGDIASLISTTSSSSSKNDSLQISGPAEIYSKLQELAKTDPEKLKAVCAKIAEMLRNVSDGDNGHQSKMLAELAEKFQNVADGGDVSQLKPPDPPGSSGGAQGAVDKYSQQKEEARLLEFLKSLGIRSDSGNDKKQVLASILAELNKALA